MVRVVQIGLHRCSKGQGFEIWCLQVASRLLVVSWIRHSMLLKIKLPRDHWKERITKSKDKEPKSGEKVNNKGKHPFVASILEGFLKWDIISSSDEEDLLRRNYRIGKGARNWPITSINGELPPRSIEMEDSRHVIC
ncbi:hypothetical protein TSUD_88520 [Trifolium subterraneum]|uniref:Uncharacterized protein n=1 Tax=Trifolium subterraneum TaxID=3900 RepID=A0A2Z6PHK6_TRISU|nr:hypothetical protein TSUD_88520 [Trifolium subterraneum]